MPSNKPDPAAISIDTALNLIDEFLALEKIDILPCKQAINTLDDEEILRLQYILKELTSQIVQLKYKRSPKGAAAMKKASMDYTIKKRKEKANRALTDTSN